MSETADRDLAAARRRIEQLEAALMRRTELLEQKQAELAAVRASKAFRAASFANKLLDRLFPLHTRRRTILKRTMRRVGAVPAALWNRRRAKNGPPPDERHLSECTPPDEYRRWIKKYEPAAAELARQATHKFARAPRVSVVVPVYNPPAAFLTAMIESVRAQTYANWELCLADGASTAEHVRPILEKAAASDPRIKVAFLMANGGIVGNSNAAAAHATGDFLALLDHDDTLAPFALHAVVAAVNDTPDADFLYSDEDKLDTHGERVEPNFKPDWSPETLRSRNFVCHLTVVKRSLYEAVGGFRPGFDGSQDYDLVLRATERAARIVHIPHVLYHWRMHAQSTAFAKGSKNYAFEAGKRAVAEHLTRLGIDAGVHDGPVLGTYQVVYHLRTQPLVSVIIPNKDQVALLSRCVESLGKSSYANVELVIVENGSQLPETHAYYRELRKQPHVRVLEWTKPFNYAAVNNFAAAQAKGELLLFLNNDTEGINPDWLEAMVKVAVQPGVGAVGAKLYYADDTIQHAGIVVGMGGVAGHAHLFYPRQAAGYMQRLRITQNVAAVTGACLLTPRAVFERVGGFDEGFVLAFNDVDLCLAVLKAGYRVVWTPDAELYHLESKTRGYEDTAEKQARFKREHDLFHLKWGAFLRAGDPYYSPHFRLDRPDFAL
ncbi:MAG: glycosyltransferase family 2 protein, partial [Gemmataceae bacterium]|nr:glycosyltransferase family 2 protein [Gemmataceae bacterium]